MMREQNVVEPCWTLPLRNTTFDCLERPCSNTAPASAITSESGNTCRKPSSKDSKVWHSEIQCFNMLQWFSMIFNVCFTCTRWHVSGSFMFSWNYWLMMGMSYEQNNMGKGPNLSPWGLVNERPRKKMWERRRHRKPWALAMRREMRRVAWRKVARWSEQGGVEWLSGKELGGSLDEMNPYQSVHDGNWTAPHPLLKQEKNMKKSSLLPLAFVTRHCSNPLPLPRLAQEGPAMSTGRKQNPVG